MMNTSLLGSKVVNISEARRRIYKKERMCEMNSYDKRREYRRDSHDRMFVQIVTSEDPNLLGTTISCQAVDVSGNGLRIQTDMPIPVGCQLDLWIDDSAGPGKYFLSSDVRWSREVTGSHHVGVELHDGAATDIDDWRMLHA